MEEKNMADIPTVLLNVLSVQTAPTREGHFTRICVMSESSISGAHRTATCQLPAKAKAYSMSWGSSDYISHWYLLVSVFTAPSHFHCECGVHDQTTNQRSGQCFTVQVCFSTSGNTGIYAEDRQQEHMEVCSRHTVQLLMPSALFLGWLDDLCGVTRAGHLVTISGSLRCTSALHSLCVDMWAP